MKIPISTNSWGLVVAVSVAMVLSAAVLACRAWIHVRRARAAADKSAKAEHRLKAFGNGALSLASLAVWIWLLSGEPPLAAVLEARGVALQYRWSSRHVDYEDVERIVHDERPGRRGRRDHELRILTARGAHRIVVTTQDPEAVAALRKLRDEFSARTRRE